MTATGSDPSQTPGQDADIARFIESQWPQWEHDGIGPDEDSILNAAAVGLVEEVWRNSPLEDMHAGGGPRGRGPSDGEMFAESVALQRVAKAALPRQHGLLEFEDHVLDRHRPWAVGGRTLQEMGYGNLGAFARHVRDRTNGLFGLRRHGYRLLLGHLILVTRFYGGDHYGMPAWPVVATSVRELLLSPAHPAWPGDNPEQARAAALAVAPPGTPLPDTLHSALLDGPDTLPLPVLDWLTNRVMYPARSLAADLRQQADDSGRPPTDAPGRAFPLVAELRFAVPPGARITIYQDLISRLDGRLREGKDRHDEWIAERIAYLERLLEEAEQQAPAN